ncbi:MAG: hypothetical protein M3480_04995, partial [Verrucomicrobiota bacterium]|nr:hypothetical protein [Verrucomicrobiota bacterium]
VLVLEPDETLAAEILSAVEEAAPGTGADRAASLGEAQQLGVEQKPALFVLVSTPPAIWRRSSSTTCAPVIPMPAPSS